MRVDCTRCGFRVAITPTLGGYKVASYNGMARRCPVIKEEMEHGEVDPSDLACEHLDLSMARAYDQWREAAALDR